MTHKYTPDEWRWYDDEYGRWYCSRDCALCAGADDDRLLRIDSDLAWPSGDDDNTRIECPSCRQTFNIPYDWEYQLRKPGS